MGKKDILRRKAHDDTDEALTDLDGLISAVDLILYQDGFTLNNNPASKAVNVAIRMMEMKMKEIEILRSAEWKAIVGRDLAD